MNKTARLCIIGLIAGMLSACTTLDPIEEIATMPAKGDGVLFVQVGLLDPHDAESICKAFPGIKDERCENKNDYDGMMVAAATHFWSMIRIPLLVPKSAGVGSHDILKIKIDGNRPAFFEFIAAKGRWDKECYYSGMYGPHTGGAGGVVCPKYDWDYRKDLTKY